MQDPIGQRRERQVRLLGGHSRADGPLRVQVAEAQVHQRVGLHDVRRRPLHHGDVDAVLVQRLADVVRGVVGARPQLRACRRRGPVRDARWSGVDRRGTAPGRAASARWAYPTSPLPAPDASAAASAARRRGPPRPSRSWSPRRTPPTGTSSSTSTEPPSPGCRTPASRRSCPSGRTPASSAGTAGTGGGRTKPGRAGTATCSACATGRRAARGGRPRWRARRAAVAARQARCRPVRRRSPE